MFTTLRSKALLNMDHYIQDYDSEVKRLTLRLLEEIQGTEHFIQTS